MKFQITNSEPIQFFNTDGELVGTILIDTAGDMTLRPESGSSRDIILGDPNVAGDVQMGLVSAPINLELLGGGTITSNGNTLNIGSVANGDTVKLYNVVYSQSLEVTGSVDVTGSVSADSFTGDGSGLTGISTTPFPFVGDAVITGSLIVSGSGTQGGLRTNTRNIILGQGAGNNQNATNGPYNVMIGYQAGYTNTTGDSNVCIGQNAGYALSTNASDDNIFIGKLAGAGGTSPAARMSDANYNIGLGYETMLYLTSGDSNIGFGFRTMRNISSGKHNLAFGDAALYNTDTGQYNIGIGRSAGAEQTSGNGNITIGSGSLGIAGESNQLRIGNGNTLTTISASLDTGDVIFASTASAQYLSTPAGNLSSISASYALTASHALNAGVTPTLQQVTDQGASTSNDITISGDLTASADISLPTNASYIKFNNAEIFGRTGGSYPGLHLASGQSANSRIWLGDLAQATGAVTMSFLAANGNSLFDNIHTLRSATNRPLILQGGKGPNDPNDGVIIQTGDASNVYQTRFEIEADAANVDAYFTNINGLGINDDTPSATLDVNGNINTTSHITASGNVSSSAASTASFGTYLGDGSQLTGISSGGGTPTFIASGSTSASADPGTGIVVNHSGSTAFSVIGDVGTLFSVDDNLTGTLFSVNDISGFPVLQAESDGEVYIGKSPQSLYTTAVISSTTAATTHSLCTLSTSSYDGGFFEYTAISASNARAGNIMSVWNGSNIVSTETTSSQIGDTTDLTTEVIISGSTARLVAYGANASYKIKTIIKAI